MGPTALGCCVSGLLRLTEKRTLNSLTTTGPAGVSSSVATCSHHQTVTFACSGTFFYSSWQCCALKPLELIPLADGGVKICTSFW